MSDQQFQHVMPHPTPTTFRTGEATMPDGTHLVVVTLFTWTGAVTVFLPDAMAAELAKHLVDRAVGLTLPGVEVDGG